MPSQIMCGTGTPDSTSSRAQQLTKRAPSQGHAPSHDSSWGVPNNNPQRIPDGLLIRLVAIGSIGKFHSGFFFPSTSMKLKSIDLEPMPWVELYPNGGLSENDWVDKYVIPNFEAQLAGGSSFELGKRWSEQGGFYAIPNDMDCRSAHDLFKQSNPYGFETVDGRIVVYVHFQVVEEYHPPYLNEYDMSANDRGRIGLPLESFYAGPRHAGQGGEEEDSIYDSDGPGSNYQRKPPPSWGGTREPPPQRRSALQLEAVRAPVIPRVVNSRDYDDYSDSSSGSDSDSDSGSSCGSSEYDSYLSSDSESERGRSPPPSREVAAMRVPAETIMPTPPTPPTTTKQAPTKTTQTSKQEPTKTTKKAAVKSAKQASAKNTKKSPVKPAKKAPIKSTKGASGKTAKKAQVSNNRPEPAADAIGSASGPSLPRPQTTNPRKRPFAEGETTLVTTTDGAGRSVVCIKIEDDPEEGDSAAGPAARTRGAASRRPVEKRTRFSEDC